MDDILKSVCPFSNSKDLLDLGHPAEVGVALIPNTAYLLKGRVILLVGLELEPRIVGLGPNNRPGFFGVVFLLIFARLGVEQARPVLFDSSWLFYEFFLILDDEGLPHIHYLSLSVLVLGVEGKSDDWILHSLFFGCLLGAHDGEDLLLP